MTEEHPAMGGCAPPPAPPTAPPADHRANKSPSRVPWIVAIVVALAVGGGGGFLVGHSSRSSPAPRPSTTGSTSGTAGGKTISVDGTMTLADPEGWVDTTELGDGSLPTDAPGDTCGGTGGYNDITEGAQVVITSDAGKTLTIVALNEGHITDNGCTFEFLAVVPSGLGFYGVQVTHRGVIKEPEAQLASVALSLG